MKGIFWCIITELRSEDNTNVNKMQMPSTNTYISVVHLNYMSDEAWKALSIIVPSLAVIVGRYLSNREHRKTGTQVNNIYNMINGELQKKLDEAREQGRQEILNQNK